MDINNKSIAFIDVEIKRGSRTILDLGGVKHDGGYFHSHSQSEFKEFLKGTQFICGHNIINFDLPYIQEIIDDAGINSENTIDTLYLSPLLFPARPYHALPKDYKLRPEESNNPLSDSELAKARFYNEINAFNIKDESLKQVFYILLRNRKEFRSFFDYIEFSCRDINLELLIHERFRYKICRNVDLKKIIELHPIELAYCLALIDCGDRYSITPTWVLKNYPDVEQVMYWLRNAQCSAGCSYCNQAFDVTKGLGKYFGYTSFKTYDGEPLQEDAVKAAIKNKSILAVFPTGGGKSLTFQLPALMDGENTKGLTVVISPLQALMKDQIDNLEKIDISEAVTINGLLDPIQRANNIESVRNGSASILYISPESLRSKTIEHLLLGRNISRFVIDEAHCFSAWGQDFRVDYLYIGDFIKSIQEKKNLKNNIPVSCFTATAKVSVIEDIKSYFKEKLSLELKCFQSKGPRKNLNYKVIPTANPEEKYFKTRELIESKSCPTIVYVAFTKTAFLISERLEKDGINAKPYHGQMDTAEKSLNQNAFLANEVQVLVATSAFGMGVDKKDIGMVIHYEISNSLENYIQEAGRAGRDESSRADCFILFNEDDLNKHFLMLNQVRLNIKEIQQIWRAIKGITKLNPKTCQSTLEIALKAGWDENAREIETRVKTAVTALESANYLKRGQNITKIYANSIQFKRASEAIDRIDQSNKFEQKQKENAKRIIKHLFSAKSRMYLNDDATARIDYISDILAIEKEDVISIVNLLREESILADAKDLTAFIKRGGKENSSLNTTKLFIRMEKFLLPYLEEEHKILDLKKLNEDAEEAGYKGVTPRKIKTIINFWATKDWVKRRRHEWSKNHIDVLRRVPFEQLKEKLEKRHVLADFIISSFIFKKSEVIQKEIKNTTEEILIGFSVHEIKTDFEKHYLLPMNIDIRDIEDTLFYLSRIEAIKIEGGFLVLYNPLTINRIEKDIRKQYTKEDYQRLALYYENKIQQIHIVGEFAKLMLTDYKGALKFTDDYFTLDYTLFLQNYFPGNRKNEIKRNLTPKKFQQLFASLTPMQRKIIEDNESQYIVVLAGPGSGKTKLLVHKLASLLLMEDVRYEHLLMLTFSRAAATEFKKRLLQLIGNAANYVEIKTFHSYCFDLLGRVGNIEKSEDIIRTTVEKIGNGEVETSRITKTVLVIDEAQDMDNDQYQLIDELIKQNEGMRVIAVGDDDQNIFSFRGSDSKYLERFVKDTKARKYELVDNFRSKKNLVQFTNLYTEQMSHRLKTTSTISIHPDDGNIRLIHYTSNNLVTPLVRHICSTKLSGTTCVLTRTNEEALQVTGLLLKNNLRAKLIQSNDEFNLYNLLEIRFFINTLGLNNNDSIIDNDNWNSAKKMLANTFKRSANLEICKNLIRDFQAANLQRKYKSDLEIFIRESKFDNFYKIDAETILVSTIHKAKGKEFENVFILLDGHEFYNDDEKRALYVAMTRAKQKLTIHYNNNHFNDLGCANIEKLERTTNTETYSPPSLIVMQLTHRDVWLDYFQNKQYRIDKLMAGNPLKISDEGCTNHQGVSLLKFSKSCCDEITAKRQEGYVLTEAKVNHIVYWKKDGEENEIKIVLPELQLELQPSK